MSAVDYLSQLVAVNSPSSIDNSPIIALIASWFEQYATEIQEWKKEDGIKGKNLIVTIPGKNNEKTIVLVGHTDTVPSSPAWTTNPLQVEEKDGKLYGLGTADTKGGIAALIEAVLTLKEKPVYDTVLVFDGDEEMTSVGALTYQASLTFQNPFFICLEPTYKQVHIGQRSLLKCTLVAKGQAIHAGQAIPEKTNEHNAINKMLHVLSVLEKDEKDLTKEVDELLGTNTQNFGTITGGTARNVFASECKVVFERRLVSTRDPEKEFERLKQVVHETEPGVELILDQIEPGFITDQHNQLVVTVLKSLQKEFPESKTAAFPAWSEAGILASKGPAVIVGPGNIAEQAHRANEFVQKEELERYVTIFQDILLQNL